jgi:hypothetical protein
MTMRPVRHGKPRSGANIDVSARYHVDDGIPSPFIMEVPLDGTAI